MCAKAAVYNDMIFLKNYIYIKSHSQFPSEKFWVRSWLGCISSSVNSQIDAISDVLMAGYNKPPFSGSIRTHGFKSQAEIILKKSVTELGITQNINKNIYIMAYMKS